MVTQQVNSATAQNIAPSTGADPAGLPGNLRGRLIIGFLAVALLPFLGISFILTVSGAQSGRDTAIRQIDTVLNYKRSAILIWGDALKAELGNVLLGESSSSPTQGIQQLLQTEDPRAATHLALRDAIRGRFHLIQNQSQYYDEFMILGLDGTVLVASNTAREGQVYNPAAGQPAVGLPLAFQEGLIAPYLTPPVYNEASQRGEIFISYPIILQGQRASGVLIGRARITVLNNILGETTGLGETGKTYLAAVVPAPPETPSGETPSINLRILAGLSRDEQGSIFSSPDLAALADQNTSESGGYAGPDLRGVPVLGSYIYVPALQAYLLGEQAQAETNRGALATLAVNASVAVSSILIALFIALQITRSIASPLGELSEIAAEAASAATQAAAEQQSAEEEKTGADRQLVGSAAFQPLVEKIRLFLNDSHLEEDALPVEAAANEEGLYAGTVETSVEISRLGEAFYSMTAALAGLVQGLEGRVATRTAELEGRTAFLQASTEVSRAVASILEPEELIQRAVDVIGESFNLYYVGLFLVDENAQWAVLRAGTGDAGQKMLQRHHRLPLGRASMIGWTISNAQPRIAQVAEEDVVRQANPDLPETRSEAAIPLRTRGRVIGALSVQSAQENAFNEIILGVLQSMADQLATAIDNANLYAQAQEALQIERRAYAGQTEAAWSAWLATRTGEKDYCYRATPGGVAKSSLIWYPEMQQAFTSGAYATTQPVGTDGERPDYGVSPDESARPEQIRLAIPISVRGAAIGALSLSHPAASPTQQETTAIEHDGGLEHTWSHEEIAFLEGIAEQLGVALDSARLYAETQLKAEQERLITELTNRMRASLDVETVIKTAAEEIFTTLNQPDLPLESVVIELTPTGSTTGATPKAGADTQGGDNV